MEEIHSNDDVFMYDMFLIQQMLILLNRTEKYFLKKPEFKEISTSSGDFMIIKTEDSIVFKKGVVRAIYNDIGDRRFLYLDSAVLNFSDITDRNKITEDRFYYSPLNRGMEILNCKHYKLDENLKHDEALYFQKLTQVDLPLEEYFIEVQNVLKFLWEGEYVSIKMNIIMLNESDMKIYENLVRIMEEQC